MKAWRIYNPIKQKNEMEKNREGGRHIKREREHACNNKVMVQVLNCNSGQKHLPNPKKIETKTL